eukprot:2642782-Rhodomonas_salina.1
MVSLITSKRGRKQEQSGAGGKGRMSTKHIKSSAVPSTLLTAMSAQRIAYLQGGTQKEFSTRAWGGLGASFGLQERVDRDGLKKKERVRGNENEQASERGAKERSGQKKSKHIRRDARILMQTLAYRGRGGRRETLVQRGKRAS